MTSRRRLVDSDAIGERPIFFRRRDSCGSNASVVLVGMRGSGKSTLAIIASSALRFRIIEADQHFLQKTGSSRAAFNAIHGIHEYRRRELEVMQSMLLDNKTKCIIICGPGSVEGKGRDLLENYSKTNLVVYVLRDTKDIQEHLHDCHPNAISNLIRQTAPLYRALSSYEFYNFSDTDFFETESVPNSSRTPPSLMLKSLQHDFLQLIYNVTKQRPCSVEHEARHVLSALPPESKQFTYALVLPLSTLTTIGTRLRDMESTADAIEFVVDLPLLSKGQKNIDDSIANSISRHFASIRRYMRVPIIFNVPFPVLGQLAESSSTDAYQVEEAYIELLHFGLRLAPEYLCVDMNCNIRLTMQLLAAKGSTKIIAHSFNSDPGLDGWASQNRKEKLQQFNKSGYDIVRMCQSTTSMADNSSVQRFAHEIKSLNCFRRPLIAYNVGSLGRLSCWQNPTLSPVTHSFVRSIPSAYNANCLLTIQEAQRALYASFELNRLFFGVVGADIVSSLSPAMYNAAFEFCGMPHDYRYFQHSSLQDMQRTFRCSDFGGASITAPFKRDITTLVDFMSPEARIIGAVNTLVPLRSKKPISLLDRNRGGPIVAFYGDNTDWIGIHRCISRSLSPANAVSGRTVALVLGAGGMARASVYALARLGVPNIFLQNRSLKKAQTIAEHFNELSTRSSSYTTIDCPRSDWDLFFKSAARESSRFNSRTTVQVLRSTDEPWPTEFDPPTIIISSLPGREFGNQNPINNTIRASWLTSRTGGVLVELAYSPLDSPLLEQVQRKSHQGWVVVNGLQILPEQGAPQFELLTGRRAPYRTMQNAVFKKYSEQHDSRPTP